MEVVGQGGRGVKGRGTELGGHLLEALLGLGSVRPLLRVWVVALGRQPERLLQLRLAAPALDPEDFVRATCSGGAGEPSGPQWSRWRPR